MNDWKAEAERLYELHKAEPNRYAIIARDMKVNGYFPELEYQSVREKVRGHFRKKGGAAPVVKEGKPPKPPKVEVIQNLEPTVLNVDWKGNKIVRFGLVGDTHLNSKYAQITYLHDMYDKFSAAGIGHVYHVGDMDEGERMRPGHQYECYTQGFDDHVAEIVRVYPRREGMTTHFITGNHDASMIKHAGANIGPVIASQRPDMHYLGADCAIVHLTPNCTLELRHPWDGTAYALSYKPQKIIEAMAGGEKPNILAIGHYHKAEYLFYRNVHCFQSGTFCGQTPFMRGKAISAHIGGWIVEVEVDERGYIQRILPEFIPCYYSVTDDYKKWRDFE